MQTYAKNNKRYWVVDDTQRIRKVRCAACGYDAAHYGADYDAELCLFTVPWAGLNGGIGEEIGAEDWARDEDGRVYPEWTRDRSVYLSRCCDAPFLVAPWPQKEG